MDLTRPIVYRGFDFNTTMVGPEGVVSGCAVERVEYGDVEVIGYTEKRSLDDGHDASDVFLGRRRVRLYGTLYSATRGGLFDALRDMRFAVSPRLAYQDAPAHRGYFPLSFFEPTSFLEDWEDGVIPLMLRVRSLGGVSTTFDLERTGGPDDKPLSIPYSVGFEAVDPRAYSQERTEHFMSGAGGAVVLTNKGGHPTPLNIMLVADAYTGHDRIFEFVGGSADFRVTVPKSDETQVVRLDGEKKVVTLQVNDVESLRMDLRSLNAAWPVLPRGESDVAWTFKRSNGVDATLKSNSLLFFRSSFS